MCFGIYPNNLVRAIVKKNVMAPPAMGPTRQYFVGPTRKHPLGTTCQYHQGPTCQNIVDPRQLMPRLHRLDPHYSNLVNIHVNRHVESHVSSHVSTAMSTAT